jgi:1-phosphatidylinositol-4-phosphate 5-kinase
MSPEEALRDLQAQEQALAAQATVMETEEKDHTPGWNSSLRRRSMTAPIPPIPNYQPPPPPGKRSSEGQSVVERASQEARRDTDGMREEDIPDRTLTTIKPANERRESVMQQHEPILPVVEEAAEASSTGGRSREEEVETRPLTPAKRSLEGKSQNLNHHGPPTPPKTGYLKPKSADSGYGGAAGNGTTSREGSIRINPRLSRESLNKELPPLPS